MTPTHDTAVSTLPPLSLYIHVPWCVKKCPYCDFNSHALTGDIPENDYLDAIMEDLAGDPLVAEGDEDGSDVGTNLARSFDVMLDATKMDVSLVITEDQDFEIESTPLDRNDGLGCDGVSPTEHEDCDPGDQVEFELEVTNDDAKMENAICESSHAVKTANKGQRHNQWRKPEQPAG